MPLQGAEIIHFCLRLAGPVSESQIQLTHRDLDASRVYLIVTVNKAKLWLWHPRAIGKVETPKLRNGRICVLASLQLTPSRWHEYCWHQNHYVQKKNSPGN